MFFFYACVCCLGAMYACVCLGAICVCVCVCVYAVHACVCLAAMCSCVCGGVLCVCYVRMSMCGGGQETTSGVTLQAPSTSFLRQDLSLPWNLPNGPSWLAAEPQASTCLCFSKAEIINMYHHIWLLFFFKWALGIKLRSL